MRPYTIVVVVVTIMVVRTMAYASTMTTAYGNREVNPCSLVVESNAWLAMKNAMSAMHTNATVMADIGAILPMIVAPSAAYAEVPNIAFPASDTSARAAQTRTGAYKTVKLPSNILSTVTSCAPAAMATIKAATAVNLKNELFMETFLSDTLPDEGPCQKKVELSIMSKRKTAR